jgi:hypothetical protein
MYLEYSTAIKVTRMKPSSCIDNHNIETPIIVDKLRLQPLWGIFHTIPWNHNN